MNACIICNSVEFNDVFLSTNPDKNDKFMIQKCKKCGLIQTKIQKNTDLSPYYRETEYFAREQSIFNFIKKTFANLLKVRPIEKIKNSGTMLDIGCGDGKTLNSFENKKWKLYGVEPFGTQKKVSPNLKIYKNEFEKMSFKNNFFDVITFWHVFEHILDPNKVLKECKRIIKNNGLLFISIPNSASMGFKIFKNNWFALYPPVHIYHYDLNTIKDLLNKNGFEVVKVDKFSIEYAPFVLAQSIQNFLGLPPNCLYKSLRGRTKNKFIHILSLLLVFVFSPLLVFLILLELMDPNGASVINIYAKPRATQLA